MKWFNFSMGPQYLVACVFMGLGYYEWTFFILLSQILVYLKAIIDLLEIFILGKD